MAPLAPPSRSRAKSKKKETLPKMLPLLLPSPSPSPSALSLPSAKCQSAKVCSKIHKISVRPSLCLVPCMFVYVAVCLFLFLWLFLFARKLPIKGAGPSGSWQRRCLALALAHLHVGCAQVLCEKAFVHGNAFNVCKQTPVRMRDMPTWHRDWVGVSTAHYHVHGLTYVKRCTERKLKQIALHIFKYILHISQIFAPLYVRFKNI